MDNVYNWEYFKNKTPYRKILEDFCDLNICSWRTGSGYYAVQHYNISYNQEKFVQNLPLIKEKLMKTKFAKTIESEMAYVKNLPETLNDFENAYAISRVVSHIICDGCIRKGSSSIHYKWDIKSRYSDDIEFNQTCATKMNRPVIKFSETNGWEREHWNFYFKFPTNEEIIVLDKLAKKLAEMPPVNQRVGTTSFQLNFVPVEYNSVNWNSNRTSYMRHNNFIQGKLNIDKVSEVLDFSNNALFEFFYKGGVENLFDN